MLIVFVGALVCVYLIALWTDQVHRDWQADQLAYADCVRRYGPEMLATMKRLHQQGVSAETAGLVLGLALRKQQVSIDVAAVDAVTFLQELQKPNPYMVPYPLLGIDAGVDFDPNADVLTVDKLDAYYDDVMGVHDGRTTECPACGAHDALDRGGFCNSCNRTIPHNKRYRVGE